MQIVGGFIGFDADAGVVGAVDGAEEVVEGNLGEVGEEFGAISAW